MITLTSHSFEKKALLSAKMYQVSIATKIHVVSKLKIQKEKQQCLTHTFLYGKSVKCVEISNLKSALTL